MKIDDSMNVLISKDEKSFSTVYHGLIWMKKDQIDERFGHERIQVIYSNNGLTAFSL